jgi:hypothetical protein
MGRNNWRTEDEVKRIEGKQGRIDKKKIIYLRRLRTVMTRTIIAITTIMFSRKG